VESMFTPFGCALPIARSYRQQRVV